MQVGQRIRVRKDVGRIPLRIGSSYDIDGELGRVRRVSQYLVEVNLDAFGFVSLPLAWVTTLSPLEELARA